MTTPDLKERIRYEMYGYGGKLPKIEGFTKGGFCIEDEDVFLDRLLALYHQLLKEERERLIGVFDTIKRWHPDTDEPCIDYKEILATLNKEKD